MNSAIELPAGLKSICGGAFFGCSGLKSVSIPSGVSETGKLAFAGSTALDSNRQP